MNERSSAPASGKPFFTVAAWFSLIGPLLAAGWAYYAGSAPHGADAINEHLSRTDFAVLAVAFAICFVAGVVSLWGTKANGALTVLPPAILGMLVSAGLEILAVLGVILSGLPGN